MSTLRLVLEYDGTQFSGWQSQPSVRTVEGSLREALARVTSESPRLTAAGRTDAGAHSHGQVVGIDLRRDWEPESLSRALNAVLPEDVAVRSAERAADGFHARYDALSRTYRYLVAPRRARAPMVRRFAWQVADVLDTDAMAVAAAELRGTHDFGAFGRTPNQRGTTVRTVSRADLSRISLLDDAMLPAHVIEVSANAFLYGMMRSIAGALVAVGRGRMTAADIRAMLDDPSCGRTITVAPARGLHQWTVTYPVAPSAASETAQ